MKKHLRGLKRATLTLFIMILAAANGPARAAKYVGVKFTLASPITMNEPVTIQIIIKNLLSQGITFSPGVNFNGGFHFIIYTPDGRQVDLHPKRTGVGLYDGHFIYLEPGQIYSQRLVLNEWYPFDLVGNYRVSLSMDLPIKIGKTEALFMPIRVDDGLDADKHQMESDALDLTIYPRDESLIRKRCDDLLLKVQENRDFNQLANSYAKELSYIKDPIAIPYLKRLSQMREEQAAINGLMRIGTDEAMEAIIEITKSVFDKSSAAYAKELLRQNLPDIRDASIREKVREAIDGEAK